MPTLLEAMLTYPHLNEIFEPVKRKMLSYNYILKSSQLKWNGFTHSKYLENILEIIQHSYF